MKKVGLFVTVFAAFILGCASMTGKLATSEEKTYEAVFEVEGKTKNDLYVDSASWFVDTFNSSKAVLEYQDKEAGKLIGKYTFTYKEGLYLYRVRTILNVDVKDNKVKVAFHDPAYQVTGNMLNPAEGWNEYSEAMTTEGMKHTRANWVTLESSLKERLRRNVSW